MMRNKDLTKIPTWKIKEILDDFQKKGARVWKK